MVLAHVRRANRNYHPARRLRARPDPHPPRASAVEIPTDAKEVELTIGRRVITLTNLQKVFWPDLQVTKGDLLRYYAAIGRVLIPHLQDRAMVMKRYPNASRGNSSL